MLILYISLLLFSFIHHGEFAMTATATLYQDGTNITAGILTVFQNSGSSPVMVTGMISGVNATSSNVHGFHVHTNPVSEPFPNCTSAGGHFNPYNTSHGPPTANITSRHVGDLGNLTANANGTIYVNIIDSIIQLYNATQSIVNRTFIIHAMLDDGGNTNLSDSAVTGNAGQRIFCGLIKLVPDTTTSTTTVSTTTSMAIFDIKPTVSILLMTMIFGYLFI